MLPPNNVQTPTTNLAAAYSQLGSVYDPQIAAAQEQARQLTAAELTKEANLAQDRNTSLSQLDQAKANAFTNNSLTSNARGLFYSGYAPAQNQTYVSNVYNPNRDKVNTNYQRTLDAYHADYNANTQSLSDKITQLNQQRSNDAQSLVNQTIQANQAAAAKAAKSGQPTTNQISNAIRLNLSKVTGRDGYVSPEDYAQAYFDWINSGQSANSFDSNFKNFQNPNNKYYNYAIANALKRS